MLTIEGLKKMRWWIKEGRRKMIGQGGNMGDDVRDDDDNRKVNDEEDEGRHRTSSGRLDGGNVLKGKRGSFKFDNCFTS
jgi:hypothetical protein